MLTEVLDTVTPWEGDIRDKEGRWYSLRIRPYPTLDNRIDGVVLLLVDVDAARRALEFSESIVTTVRKPLVVLDHELRLRMANRAFYEAFQVDPTESQGRLLYELGNGQWDIPELRRLLDQVLSQDREFLNYQVEHDFEHIGPKIMLLNARRLLRPGDRRPLILLSIEDDTERVAAAAAVARLAAIVASSDDPIISMNVDGIIATWNAGAERLFGHTADEIVGRSVTMLIPEERPAEVPQILERIQRGESITRYETVRCRKDGTRVDVSLTISPIKDASGRIVGASKIARDITERRRAEESLRESVEETRQLALELQTIYDTSPVGMLQLDRELRYVRINEALAAMNGIPAANHIGRTVREIVPHLADELEPAFRRVLETGEPVINIELHGETPAQPGVQRAWLESWYPHRTPDGRIVGLNVLAQEITDRKRDEEELLRNAAEMIAADRRKDEFLAMLAHELRNPLAPIRNALQILRVTKGNSQAVASAAEMMERQMAQLVRLVDDLLDVSRITQGKIELRRTQTELASVVYQAVEANRSLYDNMQHELTISLPPRPIYLNADAARLAQIVGNLLNNACKFTDKGGESG